MNKDLLASAAIGKTHGVEGFLRLTPFSGEVKHLLVLKECLLVTKEGKEIQVIIDEVKLHKETLLVRFASYFTPEKARMLSGGVLYIKREEAPKLKKGEYYVADLFGLDLYCDGVKAGVIESVSDGAQSLYLNVRTEDGRLVIVPNMLPFVEKPDFEASRINLLMKELLD